MSGATTDFLTETEKIGLLKLARDTVEEYVRSGQSLKPEAAGIDLTPGVETPSGVFVSLHCKGKLRGCIGYIEGVRPLYLAVMENAVSAAARDPRFSPVKENELENIDIEISVMTPLEAIDDPRQVEVGRHGVVIEKGASRGVLLPQVAVEQGWDREQFLEGVCRKAGLARDAWKESTLRIFGAQVFGEKER